MSYVYALLLDTDFGLCEQPLPTFYSSGLLSASSTLKAGKSDPDLPSYQEALTGPYAAQFKEAMQKKIDKLQDHGTWTEVPKSSVPEGK